jgi:hypothetical protein
MANLHPKYTHTHKTLDYPIRVDASRNRRDKPRIAVFFREAHYMKGTQHKKHVKLFTNTLRKYLFRSRCPIIADKTRRLKRKKVKLALQQAMKAQRGSTGVALLFL